MNLEKIEVDKAVGKTIPHDMTQIIPQKSKGARFKKGYIIKKEDIKILKDMGKEHIYVIDMAEGYLHEDEAAARMVELTAAAGIEFSEPEEGKIELKAKFKGLFKIKTELLFGANNIKDLLLTTIHNDVPVEKGDVLAGIRVNPLVIEEERIFELADLLKGEKIFEVIPFKNPKVGVVITGNEVYSGRIEDKFLPVLKRKFKRWGGELMRAIFVPDDQEKITEALLELKKEGAEVLITGGGMSVDPDDLTPTGIRNTGAEIVSFGAPVLPGNKLMTAYLDDIPLLGLPACVIFYEITVFDLIYPRILAGDKIDKDLITKLSLGGLCRHCEKCTFPNCGFGKGL